MRAPRSISFVDIVVNRSVRAGGVAVGHLPYCHPDLGTGSTTSLDLEYGPSVGVSLCVGLAEQDTRAKRAVSTRRARKEPPHSMTSETFSKPVRRTFFVADLKCYMCGSVSGSIESEQSLTAAPHIPRPVLLRQPGRDQPVAGPQLAAPALRPLRRTAVRRRVGRGHPPLRGLQLARRTPAPRSAAEAADRRAPPRTRAARIPGRLSRRSCDDHERSVRGGRCAAPPAPRPAAPARKKPMLAGRSASRRTRYGYHSSPYGR